MGVQSRMDITTLARYCLLQSCMWEIVVFDMESESV